MRRRSHLIVCGTRNNQCFLCLTYSLLAKLFSPMCLQVSALVSVSNESACCGEREKSGFLYGIKNVLQTAVGWVSV